MRSVGGCRPPVFILYPFPEHVDQIPYSGCPKSGEPAEHEQKADGQQKKVFAQNAGADRQFLPVS